MIRQEVLLTGEAYHIYNRGAHKNKIFTRDADYRRFLFLLHICNNSTPVHMAKLLYRYRGRSSLEIWQEPADKSLVDIFAYSLMPNHFHMVLRQKADGGITLFMKKVAT